ncbi:MAG: AraD1 family protein [Opitutaceae bacterium]
MTRLVQIQNGDERRVALVEEPHLRLLKRFRSLYEMVAASEVANRTLGSLGKSQALDSQRDEAVAPVNSALTPDRSFLSLIKAHVSGDTLDYDAVYSGKSNWRLLSPIDHPTDAAHCLVSGTGLTHLGSAKNRAAMHEKSAAELTDSMRMFRWGLEGGRPAAGKVGNAPEWFYKGNASVLRAPGEPLDVPPYAGDGGEEAEIAGVYFIDSTGQPRRIGMTLGNEFSDHKFEKTNYLNLASSKIRTCSIGPELVIDPAFDSVPGTASIERNGKTFWSKEIATGESEMCHSLANIEHHHFKFETHRRPGDLHVHYYGACALSFGEGIELLEGDVMSVQFQGFGRALRNPLRVSKNAHVPIVVQPLP